MRLMFVITRGDDAGGAQSHVRDLASRLAAGGHDIHVVVGARGALTDALERAGIATSSCPGLLRDVNPVHDIRAVRQLARSIRAYQPDLVTTHSSKAGTIGRLAARLAGVPCVFTVHGWAYIDTVPQPIRAVYQAMERGTAHLARKIICVSYQLQRMGVEAGIRADKLVVVHNGIPDNGPGLRANPGAGPPRAVMVARFAAPKDHLTVVRALRDVPDLLLDFAGDGPDEARARALAAELGVSDRIRFLGRRDDVEDILAASHIFILSSLSEGFPISTLEAMRAGLPVLVANAGGAGESVIEGETGYLFDRADPAMLADRLRRLSSSPDLREAMGAAGRQFYEAEFSLERMYVRTLEVYDSVLATAENRSPVLGT